MISDGAHVLPAAVPIWNAFSRLSRGRDYTAMGVPLPLRWRDILDASAKYCKGFDSTFAEDMLATMDDIYLASLDRGKSRDGNASRSN